MYISRLRLNRSRAAIYWVSNPYRVHQRLLMACKGDPRLLFRIEDTSQGVAILVQSQREPVWPAAFADFPVLASTPETKGFYPYLQAGHHYRFRLLANPTVKKTVERQDKEGKPAKGKTRQGLIREADQIAWLQRKLEQAGAKLLASQIMPRGLQKSCKNAARDEGLQTHLAVLFEGVIIVVDTDNLNQAIQAGIGPAKAYGFGLLSLALA